MNPKVGLGFSNVLRAALRQDPDVLLVGEMRDQETAEIGLRAAMTGHMVLSTLHTNDALSAPARLMDMGLDAYLIASSLKGVVAQRLIKKLCSFCSQPYDADAQEQAWLDGLQQGDALSHQYYKGTGCHHCNNTGYQGRVGIYELLELDASMLPALRSNDIQAFNLAAAESSTYRPLTLSALDLAQHGVTSLQEVFRVAASLEGEA